MKYLIFTGWLLTTLLFESSNFIINEAKMKGITMVAPPREFSKNPVQPMAQVNANWVALVPYAFSRKGETYVRFSNNRQWWGETPSGIEESIRLAQEKNMHVMLKPQVYIGGGWVGEVDYNSEKQWNEWEKNYRHYIITFAKIAAKHNIGMFCIGTEYKIAAKKRERFWRALIEEVRLIYDGKITYSSNWDSYEKVPFWDALDYVGLSAYFPLSEHRTPTIATLKKEWKPILNKLRKYAHRKNKQIIFTEYGYLSVDYCADKNWLLERKINELPINEDAQANAYAALFEVWGDQSFWAGGFLWKWFPNMSGHEGYPEKDYTPQGKKAEDILKEYYGKI